MTAKQKERMDNEDVRIVTYRPEYQDAFRTLNQEWIRAYFELEETDRELLDNPQKNILDKGGTILVAVCNNKPVGVCALIKVDTSVYELAKMAVSSHMRGKHIGWKLGQAAILWAKEMEATKIYLDSNTKLKAAVNLYYKLGFKAIKEHPTPYKRVDIQMELVLNATQTNEQS